MPIQYEEGPQVDAGLYGGLGGLLGLLGGGALGMGVGALGGPSNKTSAEYVKAGILTPDQAQVYDSIKNQTEKNAFINQAMKQAENRRGSEALNKITGPSQPVQQEPISDKLGALGQPQTRNIDQMRMELLSSGLNPQQMNLGAKIISDIEKQQTKEKEIASRQRSEAFKITSAYRSELAKEAESAMHLQNVSKEQLALSKSGKMNSALWLGGMEKMGWDLDALKSSETQQFQALEKEYLKDLKSVFGGKISNEEMKAFLRGIPKATNSPEAREAILKRLNAYYKSKTLKFRMSQKITKDNGGVPPEDLQDQVAARTLEKQNQYANEFLGIPKDAKLVQNKKTGQRAYIDTNGKRVTID